MLRLCLALPLVLLAISACAARDPAPIIVAPSGTQDVRPPTPVSVGPAIQPIGQCNPGSPKAVLSYPAEWEARLTAARAARSGEDELLGAPRPRPGDGPARALNVAQAPYPADLRALGLQGACEVLLTVTTEGEPRDPLPACTSPLFLPAARDAALTLRFDPKREGGRAVEQADMIQPVLFCLPG